MVFQTNKNLSILFGNVFALRCSVDSILIKILDSSEMERNNESKQCLTVFVFFCLYYLFTFAFGLWRPSIPFPFPLSPFPVSIFLCLTKIVFGVVETHGPDPTQLIANAKLIALIIGLMNTRVVHYLIFHYSDDLRQIHKTMWKWEKIRTK